MSRVEVVLVEGDIELKLGQYINKEVVTKNKRNRLSVHVK